MDKWRSQYPSVVVTRTETGNHEYANKFLGDSNKLLYELKNLMKFRKLGQLKMTRLFIDGTVITAWSIFGHNFVNIDVSRVQLAGAAAAIEGTCTITLIDIPLAVPPMKDPLSGFLGGIWRPPDGDVSGVDYIKTYYSFDVKKCPTCKDIAWEFLFTYATPIEARHYFNPITNLDEPDNHTVYSLAPPAWAELIDHGQDAGGNYIIWKAYTETDEYSRTGLGIMLLRAAISDNKNKIICSQERKIDVDCCLKDIDLRKVEIWWEDFGTCQPYIMYGGVAICKMPTEVQTGGLTGLLMYSSHPAQPLYSIPDIKGSCLPMEWTLTGPIKFAQDSKKNDNTIYFALEEANCNESVFITLKDRCETLYRVRGTPCCDNAAELYISYVSLLMSCSQQQELTAIGGCGPYRWSLTGGGGTIGDSGKTVVYTAPATNANCTDNPTIQVTDCCGNTASIQLAVNCYSGGVALRLDDATQTGYIWDSHNNLCTWQGSGYYKDWDCAGTLTYYYPYPINIIMMYGDPTCNTNVFDQGTCSAEAALGPKVRCSTSPRGFPNWALYDARSAAMKAAGCCPINPITGLPY